MKILLLLLLTLTLFAFDKSTIYECMVLYKGEVSLTQEEREKSIFELYVNKTAKYIRTSDAIVYKYSKTNPKYKLYVSYKEIQHKTLKYKLELVKDNKLYKIVSAKGYGDLLTEYVSCKEKKHKEK